jgi:hypothetical protein
VNGYMRRTADSACYLPNVGMPAETSAQLSATVPVWLSLTKILCSALADVVAREAFSKGVNDLKDCVLQFSNRKPAGTGASTTPGQRGATRPGDPLTRNRSTTRDPEAC